MTTQDPSTIRVGNTQQLGNLGLPDSMGGCSVSNLATALRSPEANEIVEVDCRRCGTKLKCTRFISNFVSCDDCIEKWIENDKMEKLADLWKSICPERFVNTNIDHAEFPKGVYLAAKKTFLASECSQSMFLIGKTGSAKTRVGLLLLKRSLLAGKSISVLWPENLPKLSTSYNSDTFDRFASYQVLLVDDALMTACRDAKQTEHLKQLIDVRMRHMKTTIFTSQVGQEAFKDGKQYGELDSADLERVDAIMRRLREECQIVNFAEPTVSKFEEQF